MQNRSESNHSALLLFPPGWSLNYGSPHIGLPLIKKYLDTANIECDIRDLNIEGASYYNIKISENELVELKKKFDSENAYNFYFSIADQLNDIANEFSGEWKIKSGFVFNGCDLSSSNDIKEYSKIVSPFTEFYKTNVLPNIISKRYAIIGISVAVPSQLLSAFEIFRLLRKSGFTGILVLGGNTITRLGNSLYLDWIFDIIDCIVLNQGEEAFKLIFESFTNNISFENIPNLIWKRGKDIKYNGYKKIPIIDLSMPDFHGYPIGSYWGINYLPIIAARGCYYSKCKFCAIPYSWGNNGFAGLDNPVDVFECIQHKINQYNINRFSFVEESMNPKSIQDISKLLIDSKTEIKFEGYIRLEKKWLDNSLLHLISKAGLRKVFIGMELISNTSRNDLNKNDNAIQILDYLKQFKYYGIKVHLFTLFGFPGTTEYDAMMTVDYILKHSEYIDTIDVSHFVYSKHTYIENIMPKFTTANDWALEYDFSSKCENDFNSEKAKILAESLESIIIQSKPQWTHPIYRMYSSWQ